jgi:uncharacterized integral membrane protein (TIGR00698 family)
MWAKHVRIGNFELSTRTCLYLILVIACTTPWVSAPVAFFMGLVFAQFAGNPFPALTKNVSSYLMQYSIAALGLGISLSTAVQVGKDGFMVTLISIAGTLGLGLILGKLYKINPESSLLIGAGTAICGGSAIAAVSKAVHAKPDHISIALATVFLLNALALFLFPFLGCVLHLSETQFGWWAALAIHDTSSVVGAASQYGPKALELATTVKLVRALWIIPVAIIAALVFRKKGNSVKIPWFIGGFVMAMFAGSYLPFLQPIIPTITMIARTGLTLAMFFIGSNASLNFFTLASSKQFGMGVLLWVIVSVVALWGVLAFFPPSALSCATR